MVILVMGVSGAGKTTIGRLLAERQGWPFFDADDFHPPVNVRKMASGVPLDDDDRRPWLVALRELIDRHLREGRPMVITCSALKRAYRDLLIGDAAVHIVFLKGDRELLTQRLQNRQGHFMPLGLLDSQLETLEEPEQALTVDVSPSPAEIVENIERQLSL